MKKQRTLLTVAAFLLMALPLHLTAQTYSVTVDCDRTQGSVVGEGTYSYGQRATLLALPNTGYHILYWETGDTSDVRTITVTRDTVLHLFFEANMCQLSVNSADPSKGSVEGSGNVRYGSRATIVARPNTGYAFTQWNDGNTDNPRVVTINAASMSFTAIFSTASYNVTAVSSSSTMGAVAGGGSYQYNSYASLTAIPYAGYQFNGWADGDTTNPRIVHVTQDAYYVANFGVQTHRISVFSDNTDKGQAFGGGMYSHNATAAIYATANYGYHFGRWADGNTQNPRMVQVTSDESYLAIFDTNNYNVTATSTNPVYGTVVGSGSYKYGTTATITAVPNQGFAFQSWLDGVTTPTRNITVLHDTVLIATFSANRYNLTVLPSDTAQGSVRGSGTYNSGTMVSLVATPAPHYHFVCWNDNDSTNPRQYMVTGNDTLIARFAIDVHNVTVSTVDQAKGRTVGGGSYAYGTSITFAAYPNRGYSFSRWNDGNTNSVRTETVTGNNVYTAYFTTNTYTLTAESADTLMGRVSGGGSYLFNSIVTVIAMPAQHHHFVAWSDGETANPRSIVITEDTTLTAVFGYDQFTLTVYSSDTNLGTVTGGGTYDYGDTVTLTASTRGFGRRFVSWNDGNTNAVREVVVLADRTYSALFVENDYTVIVRSADPDKGSVVGGGTVSYGSRIMIAATPFTGYEFTQWDDGNTENPRYVTITGNYQGDYEIVFVASFDVKHLTVEVEWDSTLGTVTGTGVYTYGDTVTLQARGKEGYRFKKWSDGVTENPRIWVITSDLRVSATFVEGTEGIEESEAETALVFGSEGNVVVETATPQTVVIYDALGRVAVRDNRATQGRRSYRMPAMGVYVVKVGDAPAHKVIVKR